MNVVVYCRKSTSQEGRDKQDTSVAEQEAAARAYAER
jgi:DNA invertase Pin-like site-specific DNA recombinase